MTTAYRYTAPLAIAMGVAMAAGLLGASGCATTGTPTKAASVPLPGKPACLWLSNIQGWDVLDSSTMIVYAPLAKNAYLVKLFEPVPDLSFHERVGFDDGDHDGQICSLGDDVIVRGSFEHRVPITAVRALTADQVKQLKTASTAPASSATPPSSAPVATGQVTPDSH
jgi:hypothetical protein